MKRVAVISSDASLDLRSKVHTAGYAFWISLHSGPVKQYGRFNVIPRNVNQAEIQSICNALAVMLKEGIRPDKLIVYTDNKFTVDYYDHPIKNHWKYETKQALSMLNFLMDLVGAKEVEFKHIKGHKLKAGEEGTPLQMINDWCDKMANKARKGLV